MPGGLGPESEQVAVPRQIKNRCRAAGHVGRKERQHQQPDDQDDHLDEIGHGNRPHAPQQGVGQNGDDPHHHAPRDGDGTMGEQIEDDAQRGDLRRHPSQIADHDDDRAEHLDEAAVARAVVVADGEQIHAVETPGNEQPHQDQAGTGAEGIFHDPAESILHEARRDAQHQLGAEPGGEGERDDHHQGQMAPRDREIGGVLHAPCGQEADADGDQQIEKDQDEQHGRLRRERRPGIRSEKDERRMNCAAIIGGADRCIGPPPRTALRQWPDAAMAAAYAPHHTHCDSALFGCPRAEGAQRASLAPRPQPRRCRTSCMTTMPRKKPMAP